MTTIRTTLAALGLVALSTPAFAGLASSSLIADVYIPSDVEVVSVQFELRSTRTAEVLWVAPAGVEATGRSTFSASFDLGRAGWIADDDLAWCVVVDATASRNTVEIDAMELRLDGWSDTAAGTGRDLEGDIGDLCVVGSSR